MKKQKKEPTRAMTVRLTEKEHEMAQVLKKAPFCVNISELLRAALRNYFNERINEKGNEKSSIDRNAS